MNEIYWVNKYRPPIIQRKYILTSRSENNFTIKLCSTENSFPPVAVHFPCVLFSVPRNRYLSILPVKGIYIKSISRIIPACLTFQIELPFSIPNSLLPFILSTNTIPFFSFPASSTFFPLTLFSASPPRLLIVPFKPLSPFHSPSFLSLFKMSFTSLFVFLSVHINFSIFLQANISKASSLSSSYFLNAHVSSP